MQQKNLNWLLLGLVLLTFQPLFAQSRKQARDSSVTIIFNEQNKSGAKKKKGSSEMNIVKIAPLGFVSGQFPLLYERKISDVFTIEVGAGLTHRNYVRSVFADALVKGTDANDGLIKQYPWDETSGQYDLAPEVYNFDVRQAKMGYMYRIEPRIYFGEEAPEENYLGLQYNFARYNFSIPGYKNGNFTGDEKKEYENLTDYMVHFGHQWLYDHISMEWSSAIGLRQIKGSKYVVSNTGTEGFANYNKSIINFGIGFTVGYHF